MLSDAIVLEIRRLLDEGDLSFRAISMQLGVSRGVIANVSSGRRGLRSLPAADHQRKCCATRCRDCGGLVYKPCRLCRTRAYQRRLQEARRVARPPDPSPRRVA